jgi:hypothetical protein
MGLPIARTAGKNQYSHQQVIVYFLRKDVTRAGNNAASSDYIFSKKVQQHVKKGSCIKRGNLIQLLGSTVKSLQAPKVRIPLRKKCSDLIIRH